jgi:hypothetical protein
LTANELRSLPVCIRPLLVLNSHYTAFLPAPAAGE